MVVLIRVIMVVYEAGSATFLERGLGLRGFRGLGSVVDEGLRSLVFLSHRAGV